LIDPPIPPKGALYGAIPRFAGWPKKKLVRDVRRHLATYGIQPTARFALTHRQWQTAWAWANDIAKSYVFPRWPCAREIAAQYVLLLLAEMKSNHDLKLPYRSFQTGIVPELLLANTPKLLPFFDKKSEATIESETSPTDPIP
jgi:hypothetical protein